VAKYLIKTPNVNYRGVTEGVAFADGKAVVEDEILKNVLVKNYGYAAEEVPAEKKTAAKSKPKSEV
jgi:hypothetical protein